MFYCDLWEKLMLVLKLGPFACFRRLFVEGKNVNPIVLTGAEPVLVGLAHLGAELLIQLLAGAWSGVAVDALEVPRHTANEGGLQDRSVTLALVFAEDGVRIAVDGFGIARKANEVVLTVPGHAVGLAHEMPALEHPNGDRRSRLQQVALIGQREPQVWVVFLFERHRALDRILKLKRNGHSGCPRGWNERGDYPVIVCRQSRRPRKL